MAQLHVEEHWTGLEGEGFPLLLIQGLGYATWAWRHQLGPLAERFRVIAFDNRGAGRSEKTPGPYSIEELADDAAGVLDGRRAHVFGISMGGYIAQTLALRHPELVERLVLGCTGTGGTDYEPLPEETRHAWESNAHLPPDEYARNTMYLSFRPGWTDEHPQHYEELIEARLLYPTPPETWRAQYDACTAFVQQATPVERIRAPTVVIHGDADRIVPYVNGVDLARRIPDAPLETFTDAGHLFFIEEPERTNQLLVEFLAPRP
jgi:3-oxoadipate enol-lactonase